VFFFQLNDIRMMAMRTLATGIAAWIAAARHGLLALSLLMCLPGCVTNGQRIDRLAAINLLTREVLEGVRFEHVIYANPVALHGPVRKRLYVYIDGDGRPWGDRGRVPAADPTTGNPLALKMMLETDSPSVYISRPCYQDLANLRCSSALWTSARYSETVVDSMAAAVSRWAEKHHYEELVFIGYSGGGALAVLMGERLPNTAAVVTLAGNLDIDEWTHYHDYLPLSESLNPARSFIAHPWPEVHYLGSNDNVVPPQTTEAYFMHFPYAQQRMLSGFNHTCCWVPNWGSMLSDVQVQLP
jgi:hypothetical protein